MGKILIIYYYMVIDFVDFMACRDAVCSFYVLLSQSRIEQPSTTCWYLYGLVLN